MSWDIDIYSDLDEDKHFESNYTYNVYPMYKLAFDYAFNKETKGFRELNNLLNSTATIYLGKAVNYFVKNKEKLQELNPKNGWGDYNSACHLLQKMLEFCKENPQGYIQII